MTLENVEVSVCGAFRSCHIQKNDNQKKQPSKVLTATDIAGIIKEDIMACFNASHSVECEEISPQESRIGGVELHITDKKGTLARCAVRTLDEGRFMVNTLSYYCEEDDKHIEYVLNCYEGSLDQLETEITKFIEDIQFNAAVRELVEELNLGVPELKL